VFIVGTTDTLGLERIGLRIHVFIGDSPGAACPLRRPNPPYEPGVSSKLDQEPAPDDKRPSTPIQPTKQEFSSFRLAGAEHFMSDVSIDDHAHLNAD